MPRPLPGSFSHLLQGSCLALTLFIANACTAAPRVEADAARDPTASTVIAEIALERGDCRTASETYAAAAQKGDIKTARRASEVSLNCEHLPAAWSSVKRWRALAPEDPEAATVYATVALKLYRIEDAKPAIETALKAKVPEGEAPKDAPARSAESASALTGEEAQLARLVGLLLQEADAPSTFAAVSGVVDLDEVSAASLPMLAELALQAYDTKRAEQIAKRALSRDPRSYEAMNVLARAYVMKGDATSAVDTAREITKLDPKRGAFALAETLAALDQREEARAELERLRVTEEGKAEAERRLALLALQGGDLGEAQRRFTELVTGDQASEAALLYLAEIAERLGDQESALAGYRRLIDSNLAVMARTRAAGILLDKKERGEALALLDDYISEHPDRGFELTIAKAHLLADHGELDTGLALLDAALNLHPQHPSLQYDRSVLLERAGRVKEAVAALERLLAERKDDPTVLNALGYTMADHGIDLGRAEKLIRRSLAIMPDNPAVLDSMGWVRFRRGDNKNAIVYLERAYQLAHDPEIAAHLAEVLWKNGSKQEARAVLASALARNPDSDKLKKTIERLAPAGKT